MPVSSCEPPVSSRKTSATAIPPTVAVASTHLPDVKLPKINLKKFNGKLTHWTTFCESFESSIHNNTSLSEIDK